MSTPYDRGRASMAVSLNAWKRLGYASMQAAAQKFGAFELRELENAKFALQRATSEKDQLLLKSHIEFVKGGLSRLD